MNFVWSQRSWKAHIWYLAARYPANTKHLHSICKTSAQRLRRWSNIVQMLYKYFVFTGQMHKVTWLFEILWESGSGISIFRLYPLFSVLCRWFPRLHCQGGVRGSLSTTPYVPSHRVYNVGRGSRGSPRGGHSGRGRRFVKEVRNHQEKQCDHFAHYAQ